MACEGMGFAVEPSLIPKIKADYIQGKGSMSEVCQSYGVVESLKTVQIKAWKEKWTEQRKDFLDKVSQKAIKSAESEALEWQKTVSSRVKKDWKFIDKSIDMLCAEDVEGKPLSGIDPDAIAKYYKARKYMDDMVRRSLGLADPTTKLDLTSGGKSIGENLVEAIAALRSANTPKLEEEEVQRILEAEIVEE